MSMLLCPLSANSRAFAEVLASCDQECQAIRQALETYSDAKQVTGQDVTQATAFLKSLESLRKLVQAVTHSKT